MTEVTEILRHVDHTLLKQDATWEQIREICDDGMKYRTASVCIPPCYVGQAKQYMSGCYQKNGIPKEEQTKVCTVIGFPNGYCTTAVKKAETKEALENGADEIDMVINIADLKAEKYVEIESEIRTLKEVCGSRILKVIIETCLLSEDEKIKMCELVTNAGADYIKTSTGFSSAGATFEDVRLFAEYIGPNVKIKAAGGISSIADAEEFLKLGADRLGTSRIVKLVKEEEKKCRDAKRQNETEAVSADKAEELKAGDSHGLSAQTLFSYAKRARKNSYAPYSGFRVGAALLTTDGKVYTGCNIENAAYTPTNCAERTAFFKAVSEGERSFCRIAIAGGSGDEIGDFTAPCGVCRQVMMEFCNPDTFEIVLGNCAGEVKVFKLAELFPMGFGPENLRKH